MLGLQRVYPVCEESCGDDAECGIGRGDVVGQPSLHESEGDHDDERKYSERPQLAAPERSSGGERVEQAKRRGGDEQNLEVVPPVCVVVFDLAGGAGPDVKAEVLLHKSVPVEVKHGDVPGGDKREEGEESEGESARVAEEGAAVGEGADEGSEWDDCACGAFCHGCYCKSCPEEVPAGRLGGGDALEPKDGDEAAEGEEDVGFADTRGVKEAEGGEEHQGTEPGGELSAGVEQPAVPEADDGDSGERRGGAGPECADTEETEEKGGDPEQEGWFLEPGLEVPVGDEPAQSEHLAGDLGVDAFVPVGERLVPEQREQDGTREEGGQCG